MNILFLDVETTGLDPNKHSIIQIAAEYHVNGKLVTAFNKKFCTKDSTTIDLGALRVNNNNLSTIKKLRSQTTEDPEQMAVTDFVNFILSLNNKEQIIIAGENVNFDINFINALFNKYNIEGFEAVFSHRVIDTATIALFLKDVGLLKIDKLGLSNVAKALGLTTDSSKLHDAEYDVQLTAQVYYAMAVLAMSNNLQYLTSNIN